MFPDHTLLDGRIERAAVAASCEAMKAPVRVVFLTDLVLDARIAFNAVRDAVAGSPFVSRVSAANGSEHVEMLQGGSIHFMAARREQRPVSAGIIFVSERLMHEEETRMAILTLGRGSSRIITF